MSAEDSIVFVIDDDDAVRDSLQLLLESHGMKVAAFASTTDFVRDYRPNNRECLILDQNLQDTTGLAFLASPAWQTIRIPVILVTGRGDGRLRDRALAAGAVAYLDKPLDEATLVAAIGQAIATRP